MVKILAAGDLHGDSMAASRLAQKAVKEDVDVVLLCGDIVGSQDTVNLIQPFKDVGKKVLLIGGNHDGFATVDFLASLYDVKNLHGYAVRYEDVGFVGCGGANVGIEQLNEEEIFKIIKDGLDKVSYLGKKVVVSHMFPSDSLMDKLSHPMLPGSQGLSRVIKELKPNFLFCSHAHEAAGIEEMIDSTKVICVGKEGKIVDL